MLFSKNVYKQRETARYHFLSIPREARKPLCPAFLKYLKALHDAEAVYNDATEDEREAYETAKAAADALFSSMVKPAEVEHDALLASLSEDDVELRKQAKEAFHAVLGSANSAYERKINAPSLVLKAIEAQAIVVYERVASLAYAEFMRELGVVETSENRSSCDAGRSRFVFQKAG